MTTETIIAENMPTGKAPTLAALRAAYCDAQERAWKTEAVECAAWAAFSNVEGTFSELRPAWQVAERALSQAEATLLSAQAAYKAAVLAESEGR